MQASGDNRVLILGAGVAGMAAATALRRRGVPTLILESEDAPGGLLRTERVGGVEVDHGPKILLVDRSPVRDELLGYLQAGYDYRPQQEHVYLERFGLLPAPLQRHLVELPAAVRERVLADFERAQASPVAVRSYRDWLLNGFGEFFCELVLFPYEEKKWQTPLDDLAFDWALDRPVHVDRAEVIKGARERLPPAGNYYYPRRGGIGALTQPMAAAAGPIALNRKVTAVLPDGRSVVASGETYTYTQLISTIPLDDMVTMTRGMPAGLADSAHRMLRRLSVCVVNLVFPKGPALSGTAIYFPEPQYPFRRVTVLENLCPGLATPGHTPISVEFSLAPDDQRGDAELLEAASTGLRRLPEFSGLASPVASRTLRIGFAYPVQTRGLHPCVDSLHQWYGGRHIFHCGRGGNYDYCNADRAYEQGKRLGDSLRIEGP